jgi:hypothetical protein
MVSVNGSMSDFASCAASCRRIFLAKTALCTRLKGKERAACIADAMANYAACMAICGVENWRELEEWLRRLIMSLPGYDDDHPAPEPLRHPMNRAMRVGPYQ